MRDRASFWERQRRSFEQAWKAFRKGDPEGPHDLSEVLAHITVGARAAGRRNLSRRARRIRRRLSELCALEADRHLLARVRRLGLLSPEATAGLDVHWEELARVGGKGAVRKIRGRPKRRLRRALSRRSRSRRRLRDDRVRERLVAAREQIWETLAPPAEKASDRDLRHYRLAIQKMRDLTETLVESGLSPRRPADERDARICEAFDRWNDVRRFRKRLARERRQAESRGAVTLALELDRLIETLAASVSAARLQALGKARNSANVAFLRNRTA